MPLASGYSRYAMKSPLSLVLRRQLLLISVFNTQPTPSQIAAAGLYQHPAFWIEPDTVEVPGLTTVVFVSRHD